MCVFLNNHHVPQNISGFTAFTACSLHYLCFSVLALSFKDQLFTVNQMAPIFPPHYNATVAFSHILEAVWKCFILLGGKVPDKSTFMQD